MINPQEAQPGYSPPDNKPQIIEPGSGWFHFPFAETWRYRELLYFLVWRDIKVRYKQSFLGVAWILLQPLLMMVIFTVVFYGLLGIDSGSDVPYPVFVYSALLPWTYFANSMTRSSTSLVGNSNLISKIYFPRVLIPISGVLPGLLDFGITFVLLLLLMLFYGIRPGIEVLALPLVLLLAMFLALGVSLWLSALHVQYRDVQYLVPFIVQVWMYATPVIYPISKIPEEWLWLYNLNPMVGVVDSFRSVLLGDHSYGYVNWVSIVITILTFVSGLIYFRKVERSFADII